MLAEVVKRCEGRRLWPVVLNPARFNQRTAVSKGFPDLMIVGPGGVLYRELKTNASPALRSDQTEWKHRLGAAGQDWAIWMPADLDNGQVDAELKDVETPDEYSDEWSLSLLSD